MAVNIKKDFGNTRSRKPDLTTLVYGKVPPQAPDLEVAVLGAAMLERESFEQVMNILKPESFYVDAHQKIWAAMFDLHKNSVPVDLLTITAQLRKTNELEIVGGAGYLTQLTMSVLSSAHIEAHARIVAEKFMQREVIRICGAAIGEAYEDSADVFDLIDSVDKSFREIGDGIATGDTFQSIGNIYENILHGIEEQKHRKSELIGVDTGYDELNRITLGLNKADFIIIAGLPSDGKTALMLNLVQNAVESTVSPAGQADIFSIESAANNLGRRFAASKLDIFLKDIRRGMVSTREENLLHSSIKAFRKLPIFIDDKTQELSHILAAIRRSHKKYMKTSNGKAGLPFMVAIDYLQLITVSGASTEEQQISKASKALKKLCIELDIIIIALAQLNNDAKKRSSNKPMASDLRYSSQPRMDAQIIILLWHEEVDSMGGNIKGIKTHLLIAKNKDGETGDVLLKFAGDIQRWKNYEDYKQNDIPSGARQNFQSFSSSQDINETKDITKGWEEEDLPF